MTNDIETKQIWLSGLIQHSVKNNYKPKWVMAQYTQKFFERIDFKELEWKASKSIPVEVQEYIEDKKQQYIADLETAKNRQYPANP